MKFYDLPKNYSIERLRREQLFDDPFKQLFKWVDDVRAVNAIELNAMTLATATASGKPSCRTVLLKEIDDRGLIFFSHYDSRKGKELTENPYAMVTFFFGMNLCDKFV